MHRVFALSTAVTQGKAECHVNSALLMGRGGGGLPFKWLGNFPPHLLTPTPEHTVGNGARHGHTGTEVSDGPLAVVDRPLLCAFGGH